MTAREAATLRPGDRVLWQGSIAGRCTRASDVGRTFHWDDGATGCIRLEDMRSVSRAPEASA